MKQFHTTVRGMMMLEVLIALLIFTLGVLGMVKMQAVSAANSVNSEDRATAALLAEDLISELWAAKLSPPVQPGDYGPVATTGTWQWRVNKALRDGAGDLQIAGNTATVKITWSRQLGRNLENSVNSATDAERTATYATQVIFP